MPKPGGPGSGGQSVLLPEEVEFTVPTLTAAPGLGMTRTTVDGATPLIRRTWGWSLLLRLCDLGQVVLSPSASSSVSYGHSAHY